MKDMLRRLIRDAVKNAVTGGAFSVQDIDALKIDITKPKDEKFGDFAANIAMILARPLGRKPRELAEIIKNHFPDAQGVIDKIEIAGAGFINVFLSDTVWRRTLDSIHERKDAYGRTSSQDAGRTLLEFVSANPTGPLHVGHGRGAAVGDTLARLLRAVGRNVTTEYYVNDTGNQMKILGRSLWVRFRQASGDQVEMLENHYVGDYMIEIARELHADDVGRRILALPEDEAVAACSVYACDKILSGIKADLEKFGVTYDRYFSERSLHESKEVEHTLDALLTVGKAEKRDGALWFLMEGDQDEKDRVLVRATGEPTYFAADAAYHANKVERGFTSLIDIWGSDHHGYVPRVKASIAALGNSPDMLTVILVQFVTLIQEGKKISMSTRSGEFVTLRDVLAEVGSDAARFFFLTKRSDSHLDFDMDLAKKQSRDNPVYYVQYAHARVRSIFRIAAENNIDTDMSNPDLSLLALKEEKALMKRLADFPDLLVDAADALEPHRLTFYLVELAEMFHAYYHDNRVLTEDVGLKKARLYLVEAVRQVIENGLGILGVSAPERM